MGLEARDVIVDEIMSTESSESASESSEVVSGSYRRLESEVEDVAEVSPSCISVSMSGSPLRCCSNTPKPRSCSHLLSQTALK